VRVRNVGTLGGNLCFADPHSEAPRATQSAFVSTWRSDAAACRARSMIRAAGWLLPMRDSRRRSVPGARHCASGLRTLTSKYCCVRWPLE
jgi:hypothetical protein